jgi:hypothetical protein
MLSRACVSCLVPFLTAFLAAFLPVRTPDNGRHYLCTFLSSPAPPFPLFPTPLVSLSFHFLSLSVPLLVRPLSLTHNLPSPSPSPVPPPRAPRPQSPLSLKWFVFWVSGDDSEQTQTRRTGGSNVSDGRSPDAGLSLNRAHTDRGRWWKQSAANP